jgi:hypothetical protein
VSREALLAEVYRRLGYRRLSRGWAKVEILLGLAAAGIGLLLAQTGAAMSPIAWEQAGGGLALFTLGGYLALAGHRSHLYQSANEQLALLIEEIRQSNAKDSGL